MFSTLPFLITGDEWAVLRQRELSLRLQTCNNKNAIVCGLVINSVITFLFSLVVPMREVECFSKGFSGCRYKVGLPNKYYAIDAFAVGNVVSLYFFQVWIYFSAIISVIVASIM